MSLNIRSLILGAHIGFARRGAVNFRSLTGTLGVTNGSTALVGVGTNFDPDVAVGQKLSIAGRIVQIATLTDDTHIVLSAAWDGDTATGLTGYRQGLNISGPTIKPVSTIPAHWLEIGTVDEATIEPNLKTSTVIAPLPGSGFYQPRTKVSAGSAPMLKIKTNEVSEISLEAIYCSGPIEDATEFTPGAGTGLIEGWLQIKRYSGNTLALLVEQYGFLSVKSEKTDGSGKYIQPEYEFEIMGNALAIGNSTLASV